MARTNAANPAAELASPAAVGKLFEETICRGKVDSFAKDGSFSSTSALRARRERRQAWERGVWSDCGALFRRRVSLLG